EVGTAWPKDPQARRGLGPLAPLQTPPDPGHAGKPASYSAVHIPLQRRFCSQPLCQAVVKWAHTGETHLLSCRLDCKGGVSCPGCCGLEGRGSAGWQRRHRGWLRGRHLHCRNCQGIAHIHPPTAFPAPRCCKVTLGTDATDSAQAPNTSPDIAT
uniref:Uncharacterized protein n=1 Tax=Dromaius novaehollandiae TaxID=8790 RepID=A0A8C4PB44_DRONO